MIHAYDFVLMKTIHILSGGMDSTVLLHHILEQGNEVKCISFNYGQRHSKELDYAKATCFRLNVPLEIVDLSDVKKLLKGSSQTDDNVEVPHGHYEEDNMKKTVVPNRNMMMLSIAAAYAFSTGSESVAYGAHNGDHAVYPDCRKSFVDAMQGALNEADWNKVELYAPFLDKRKEDIVTLGEHYGIDWTTTWSCYEGGEKHCGKCGTCQERIEAFSIAGVKDPTEYDNV